MGYFRQTISSLAFRAARSRSRQDASRRPAPDPRAGAMP